MDLFPAWQPGQCISVKELAHHVIPQQAVVLVARIVRVSTMRVQSLLLSSLEQTCIGLAEVSHWYWWDATEFLQVVQLIGPCQRSQGLLMLINSSTDTDRLLTN